MKKGEIHQYMEALRTDIAIIGGGFGACAAALAAARLGRRVILTEETHWIGGQLTNQAVPPDEHPWIEDFGATASYCALRRGIRDYYRAHAPLTAEARAREALNPGNGWVSRLCHDPRVAVAALHQMMVPYHLNGRLFVMHPHRPISAWTHGDRITGVVVRGLESGRDSLIEAQYFICATPYGDLLDLSGVEHAPGAESHSETGEPHAPERADTRDQQAITVCFAMEYIPGEDHTIDKPRRYDLWREFHPPGWPGPLLGWTTVRPETHEPLTRFLFEAEDAHPWWRFRIFAALRGAPFTALPYASKVTGLLEDLSMETPPLGAIGIGQLIARIDRDWDTRSEIRQKIAEHLPMLKTRARRTNELLVDLLRKSSPE